MTREEANIKLARLLIGVMAAFPEQRFHQILRNCDFIQEIHNEDGIPEAWVNEFNTEPQEVLKRVEEAIERILSTP